MKKISLLLPLALALPWAAQAQGKDTLYVRGLAATCANCHGTNGNARGDMKPLAGVPAETLVALLNSYKTGAVTGTIMHQIAKGYSDAQIQQLAAYFADQKK